MDRAASLMNDSAKSIYPYTIQLPYLNMALEELQTEYELNEVPVSEVLFSNPILIPANTRFVGYGTNPSLPMDLVEVQVLWERPSGIDPFIPVTPLNFLPEYEEGAQIPQLIWYVWENNGLNFLPANQNNDIKIQYQRSLFKVFTDVTGADKVAVINAASFLWYRTASLLAQFSAENPSRAAVLASQATDAMDTAIGIATKGRQGIMTRRRPFRAGFKRRVYM